MPHPSHPGRFDDLFARNTNARWLYAKGQIALVKAAAMAKPLTKEKEETGSFGYQIVEVDNARRPLQVADKKTAKEKK